jgi:imidazole glycerol-phosphate synthase subunit HisF
VLRGDGEVVELFRGAGHDDRTFEPLVRRRLDVALTVGGGIRTAADAEAILDAGADKVSLNTDGAITPRSSQRSPHATDRRR